MSKKLLVFLLAVALVLTCAACQPQQETTSDDPVETEFTPFDFTDSCGRTVSIDAQVEKIIPSGPLAQMVLLAICPDMFVGIPLEWSQEAALYLDEDYYNLPITGQLYGGKEQVNFEEVAASGAQLIIDVGEAKGSIVADMDDLTAQTGVTAVHIEATLSTMGDCYRMLGQLLGREERGEELAAYCDEIYGEITDIMAEVGENKVGVLYCLGDQGLNVLAQGSFHSEVLDLMTNNLAVVDEPSSKGTGNEVDMEQLLLWDPQVILFAPDSVYDTVGGDPLWQQMQAIADQKYYRVPFGPYNWLGSPPSINRYMGMIWLAELLYPDVAEFDLYQETARYYDLFYGCDLSEEMYNDLVAKSL